MTHAPDTPPLRDDEQTMRAWARMALAYRLVLDAVGLALKQAGLPPLGWYDVLLELDRVSEEGLRAVALEKRLLLAQHNVSRLLARLDREGLVTRAPCPEDGRGATIRITPKGRDLRARMWPVYRDAVRSRLGPKLGDADIHKLAAMLGRIIG